MATSAMDKAALRMSKNREAAKRSRQKRAALLQSLKEKALSAKSQVAEYERQNLYYGEFLTAYGFPTNVEFAPEPCFSSNAFYPSDNGMTSNSSTLSPFGPEFLTNTYLMQPSPEPAVFNF